ncbi:hypothetical protein M1P97_22560 [Parabacteroides sp. GYB001]|uniref:InlB B-repeat-containing protein n=1 Tax=Parabacteroides leei TaxID=2939491 RepID=UPI002016F9DF|nr:hypothetical protein [Parabacteroides leei]MCL3854076.1 hypothetical protein [Parabacteroides leei]
MKTILLLCLSILFLPLTLAAEGLTVTGGTQNTDYSYKDNVYTVLTGTALTFSGTTTTDRIVIAEEVTADITLNNADIQFTSFDYYGDGNAAFHINKNASATITLTNTNVLESNGMSSGLEVPKGASVIIKGDGKLTATGGQSLKNSGAGIGTKRSLEAGSITINSGTIIAKGGNGYSNYWGNYSGYGIGSYSGENVVINGGNITANGGTNAGSGNGDPFYNVIINGGTFTDCTVSNIIKFDNTNNSFTNCTLNFKNPVTLVKDYSDCKFNGNITIASGNYTNCKLNDNRVINGDVTINSGIFTNCIILNIIKFDNTNNSFTNCTLNFKNPVTLIKDYSDCELNGDITIASGNYRNCKLNDKIVINGGTLTDCPISGNKVIINKGTINNTEDKNITAKDITITGGNINIQLPETGCVTSAIEGDNILISDGNINIKGGSDPDRAEGGAGIRVSEGHALTITGGYIDVAGGRDCAGIGGTKKERCGTVIVKGGTIKVKKGSSGGSSSIGGGYDKENSGTLTIEGGSLYTDGTINASITNNVYLGITPEIENVTDISVDNNPYYINQNYAGDNKLYLYMTGADHTITVRKNDNSVTTYTATYVSAGVGGDGRNKGYFTFDAGSTTTPTDNSAIAFEAGDITATYNKESNELKVKLTVTEKVTFRSAAMNSVQLTLTDGANIYFSDHKTVTGSGDYTFTFDTKGLNVGSYTLTANYGGSATSLTAGEQTKTLTIEKAEGNTAADYTEPNALTATYGQTLIDVVLPGGWAWNASGTSVGNVSSPPNTFAATFTPADTKNYKTVSKNLSVTVNKAIASDPGTPAVLSPSSVTYGTKLSGITITDGWQWMDGTIVPTVTNSGYTACFPVTDYTNYDWSRVNGYNEVTHKVNRTITVTVNRADLKAADFTFAAPTDLACNDSKKEATVEAKSGLTGIGAITIKYYKEGVETDPIGVGEYTVKIDVAEGDNYKNITDLEVGTFSITPKQYTIAIASPIDHGTVTADKTQATEGETVTLTVNPTQGYKQETLSYTTDGGITGAITGTTFLMPADNVTVTATFKASSVPPVNPPVDPDDPDDSAPVRYTVTLPAIEGAATDPVAGSYKVEDWTDFTFSLTVDEGYLEQSQPVVKANGVTIESGDGKKYVLKQVCQDTSIEIEGIVKDHPTANEWIDGGIDIRTEDKAIYVAAPRAMRLRLIDISGRVIRSTELLPGENRIGNIASGIYVLVLDGVGSEKIIVK